MKALFEIRTIVQDWKPPFSKVEKRKEVLVGEGMEFERDGKENVFKVHRIEGDRVLVEFSLNYIMKDPAGPVNRLVWLQRGEGRYFSASWRDNGLTKHLTYKGVTSGKEGN